MNFYPFHPGDYMLRTAHLEPLEDLAYRRLLDLYYINEKPLQGSADDLARVIRMRASTTEVAAILDEFFVQSDSGWQHGHCDQVISQYQDRAQKAAENGKRGGRPKKEEKPNHNPEETQPFQSANPDQTQVKANQNHKPKPITKESPPTPLKGEEPAKPSRKFDPIKACPENVTPEVWADWVKFRKELRKPLTETSCEQQAKSLAGHSSPDQVILASISAGWQGLFPDRISNVTPIRGGKPTRPALKPGEFYDLEWDDKNPATHKIYHTDTHDPTTGYAWVWLKKQTWYRP